MRARGREATRSPRDKGPRAGPAAWRRRSAETPALCAAASLIRFLCFVYIRICLERRSRAMSSRPRDPNPATEIKVNGKSVPANPFIQEFVGETILAMVRKLKRTDEEVARVEVTVTRRG